MKKETELSALKEIRDILKSGGISRQQSVSMRFIRNSDGIVIDKRLNLIWYPTLPKRMTWEEAKKECQKIGCRLPTRQELESLLDLTKCNPAIDKEIFSDTKIDDYYWTADTVAGYPDCAWFVSFSFGYVDSWDEGNNNYVRPVRSSQ